MPASSRSVALPLATSKNHRTDAPKSALSPPKNPASGAKKSGASQAKTAASKKQPIFPHAPTPSKNRIANSGQRNGAVSNGASSEGAAKAVVTDLPPVASSPSASSPKAKRSRVPKDFADKYSAPQKERKVVAPLPVVEKKARKTAQQREQLRQLMTPDDDILQRLSRVATVKVASSKPRRKAQWESLCGKCGATTTFSTPAALCAKCGAIAVRVLD